MAESSGVISGTLPRPFGKYTLTRELGRGAMGIVFEARDSALDRRVALKMMLPSDASDPKEAELEQALFTREARLCAGLEKHPNIVGIYEFGTIEGRRYIAMEFIDGLPLSDWTAQRRPSLRTRVRMLRDVAYAVHHAHQSGILHRDLKPKNVLVDPQGRPFVTDFGMAKRVGADSSTSSSSAGTVVGTPSYMSPEQAQGLKKIDRRTDVYALGAMLYEILTGKPPFPGEMTIVALMRVVQDLIPPPSAASPEWAATREDKSIEDVCVRALAKNPDDRFPSALEFGQQLAAWLGEKPATPPKAPEPPKKRPSGILAVAIAAGVLALGGLATLLRRPAAADWSGAADLLRLVDPSKDAVSGTWTLDGGKLTSPAAGAALIEIPWKPGADYDLGLTYVAPKGAGDLAIWLPSAAGPFLWQARVPPSSSEQRAEIRLRGSRFEVSVRGVTFERHETYVGTTATDPKWTFRDPKVLGLGCADGAVQIRRIDLLEPAGKGARSRP